MAEINLFHYQKGNTALHKLDTRFKLILLLLYSALIFRFEPSGMIILSLIIIIVFFRTLPAPAALFREMRGVFFILVLIFTGTLMSTPGTAVYQSIPALTYNGLIEGTLAGWRFLMVVFIGLIFSSTTLPEQIHISIYQILKPLPFIDAASIASKVSLTIMFIPVLMDMLNEILEARKTRYIEGSRNPVRNIISMAVPLMAGVVNRAEETAMALEARLYNGEAETGKTLFVQKDFMLLLGGILPVILALTLQIIDKNI